MAGFDDYPLGVEIEDRYLMQRALSGDMAWVVSPEALAGVAGAKSMSTREVEVSLQTADGEVHRWFNKDITNGVTIADTHLNTNATIPSTTLQVRGGKAKVVVTLPAATYVAAETNTLTVAQASIAGTTVAQKTSVQTIA